MKRILFFLAFVPLLAGCGMTRIVTVSPDYGNRLAYTTTVTVPQTRTATTTTRVYAADNDISLYLDLQAVAAAFAQSSTIEEFENLLNDSSFMLSNLDLNNDGYVDYLRVLETVEGNAHVFVIQAVLSNNIYQDVATVVAEVSSVSHACVQVIGSSFIYGPNYIIQPVYVVTPPIFAYLFRPAYRPWRSPWYWGHFPPHYRRPAPVYLGHYQAYINTYMHNHVYCREVHYASACHYPDYVRVSRDIQRNDYGQQHPERSFTVRVANAPVSGTAADGSRTSMIVNARDIREMQNSSSVRTTSSTQTRSATGSTARTAATAVTRSGQSSGTATTSRSSQSSGSSASRGQTTVRSSVKSSGSSSTRISTVSPSGATSTVKRGSDQSQSQTQRSVGRSAGTSTSGATRR